ncbi:hypothetical protein OG618_01950 [Kitasatospora sp. NBC_01246]|uniref:hypothetical protein n=1 Tax=Kitasatospora sp. NBC_01246 TaxID=2903570 RepID=UPI002E2FD7C8|nr:hypothetical protein [Kitasatospora sp. NBC_01246]
MKKIKTAVAAAVLAGVASMAAPASAVAEPMHCTSPAWGGEYLCGGEFGQPGMAEYAYRDGRRQVFVIGTDHAVWTRSSSAAGKKTAWTSLGGYLIGGVGIIASDTGGGQFEVGARGTDGGLWARSHAANGSWTAWARIA